MPNRTSINHNEWVIDYCRVREAWQAHSTKGENVVIAQGDVGWTTHPQLPFDEPPLAPQNYRTSESKNFIVRNPQFPHDWDLSGEDGLPPPKWGNFPGHGTATASVIISPEGPYPPGTLPQDCQEPERSVNAFVTGVAPGAVLIPFKVSTGNVILCAKNLNAIKRCLRHCMWLQQINSHDVAVFTMSLGTLGALDYASLANLRECLRDARRRGILIFCAAGQLPFSPLVRVTAPALTGAVVPPSFDHTIQGDAIFPACDINTIGIGANVISDDIWDLGLYGSQVDISVPGVDVWRAGMEPSATPSGARDAFVGRSLGSSYSTAIAAGICALWQSKHGRTTLVGRPGRNGSGRYRREKLMSAFLLCVERSSFKPPGFDTATRGVGIMDALALLDEPLPSVADVDQFHRARFDE